MTTFNYQETSITVVPGKVFDTIELYGCNLKCPYCYTTQFMVQREEDLDTDKIYALIVKRAKQIDGILFSGGEPTIFPELIPLIKKIKQTLSLNIILETNGLNTDFIKETAPYLHTVKIDVKSTPDYYDTLQSPYSTKEIDSRLRQLKQITEESNFCTEYHTTMYPPLIDSYKILYKIASYVPLSASWYLHQLVVKKDSSIASIEPFSQLTLEKMITELRIDLAKETIYLRKFSL